jgi:hypothetical protein
LNRKCENGEKSKTDATSSHVSIPWLIFPGGVTAADKRGKCKRRAEAHQSGDFWAAQDRETDFVRAKR